MPRTKKPRCFYCDKRPVRAFPSLRGELGRAEFFCSIRCAIARAMEPLLIGCFRWCEKHEEWEDHEGQERCARESEESDE